MSERTSDRTGRGQDLLGIALCMIGGFSVVSILLAMKGQESHNLLTRPVEGLIALAGPVPGLLFSAAMAALGAMMFLRSAALPPLAGGRHLAGLAGVAFGLAMVVGGSFAGAGGRIGAALPGVLGGVGGTLLGLVVGLVVAGGSAWLAWPDLRARLEASGARRLGVNRIGAHRIDAKPGKTGALAHAPADETDGVSSAEALALQPVPPSASPGAAPPSTSTSPRTDVRVGGGVPAGTRPLAISDEPRARSIPSPPETAGDDASPRSDSSLPEQPADPDLVAGGAARSALEGAERAERARGSGPAAEVGVLKPATGAVDTRPNAPIWEDEAAVEDAVAPAPAEPAVEAEPAVKASWEQVGLFDEADEAHEVEEADADVDEEAAVAEGDLEEDAIDEEGEETEDADEEELDEAAELEEDEDEEEADDEEEDEEEYEDEAAELEDEDEEEADDEEEDAEEYEDEEAAELDEEDAEEEDESYVLTPPRADGASLSTDSLLFEAGCLILEEERVAVSMLQRRFQLDFDQACNLLDQLQEAGLIGPYVGGRTREILLDAEQWQAMAAESAAS